MSEASFHLYTSLRYDPLLLESPQNSLPTLNFISPSPFYMLVYHRDRMLEAAQHFEFNAVAKKLEDGKALHETLLQKVKEWMEKGGQDEALKLRVLFDKEANLNVEISVSRPVPLSLLYPPSLDPPDTKPTPHPANTFKPSPLTGGALTLGPTDSLPSQPPSQSQTPESPNWLLRLDTTPTSISPFTSLKTSHRPFYSASRSRALPTNTAAPALAEVMLYNECQEMTEGSITSLYFYRGGKWVTPPVGVPAGDFPSSLKSTEREDGNEGRDGEEENGDGRWDEGELRKPFKGRWGHSVRSAKVGSGGQRGTTRRWALSQGMCMEETVGVDTVTVGEGVWVSNGVIGFGFGRVVE
ncbi:hypothetical protein K469DRAFT_687416 [Zopfia rhizophila CBS 207.26]|uniref:D-aminoacid aminotransferase-like PLP-dependent enzyme n=1 Tax=Zopfia rhizophila CBS 207.26 TaxID=1314779 RepID=A0A6A6E727_9PEZI|nr:hypothetical protein K469DRAFT_687416 [Zopfia rhizophila CBS 207.26]